MNRIKDIFWSQRNRIKNVFWSQRNKIKDVLFNQRNRIAAAWVMALVWWCVFYPELCFPQDTYEVVCDTKTVESVENDVENNIDNNMDNSIANTENTSNTVIEENYPQILQADDEQIVIGSRLFEWFVNKKN